MNTNPQAALAQTGATILGAGGHASEILAVIESHGSGYKIVVADENKVTVDRFASRGIELREHIVLEAIGGDPQDTAPQTAGLDWPPFIAALGYPGPRFELVRRALEAGLVPFGPLVASQAIIGTRSSLAAGSVVMGNAWLSPLVILGEHSHVFYGVSIGHDTKIGSYCSILPSATISGDVTIGDRVLVGANATILPGLSIGDGATIGAGAVVTRPVKTNTTMVGNPAREHKKPQQ